MKYTSQQYAVCKLWLSIIWTTVFTGTEGILSVLFWAAGIDLRVRLHAFKKKLLYQIFCTL
jgi:hypothetical protein